MVGRAHDFMLDPSQIENVRRLAEIEDLESRIKNIMSHDWTNRTPEQIWRAMQRYLKYLPLQATYSAPLSLDQLRLYRCRSNIDEDIENIDFWSTYGCPPPAFCKENGRANPAGFPVFYRSDNAETAIAEMKPQVGDILFHSEWAVRAYRETSRTIFFPMETSTSNQWHQIAANYYSTIISGYGDIVGEQFVRNALLLVNWIASAFVHESPPYYVSSAIASKMLSNKWNRDVDYIVYPSFETKFIGANLAFHPNFALQNMYLMKVLKLKVHESNEKGVQVEHLSTGYPVYNAMQWMQPRDGDLDFPRDNRMG